MGSTLLTVLSAVLGFALLMVVHELGHHLVARAFKMRVLRFSIGFGPAIWRHQPRGSDTVYQVALLPFLAYVQIDGMNPFEEIDPNDKGSYANASLIGRVLTVVAGPLANYGFAILLFFATLMMGGRQEPTTVVDVQDKGAASESPMRDGDKIVRIGDTPINTFEQMRQLILRSPNKELTFEVLREKTKHRFQLTPRPTGPDNGGLIGVIPIARHVEVAASEALVEAAKMPGRIIYQTMAAIYSAITGQGGSVQVSGPLGIASAMGDAADLGLLSYLHFLGFLSASLCGLNLVPYPALDGGRLVFLLYEAASRRKANGRWEAAIHGVGMLMLLLLMIVVTVFDFQDF